MTEVISTVRLTKLFGKVEAVKDLNLSVKKGEIYGFLGLNGAGKTTTIRMLLGLAAPTSGQCYLNGVKVNPGNLKIWENVGYIVETPYSYPELTLRENLAITAKLRGVADQGVDWIIRRLNLEKQAEKKTRELSMGNAQRLGLAKALIHRPEILLLDEPTNGLDPSGIVEVRRLLRDLTEQKGVTVLLSSHKLDEISKIATNIGIIHDGKLIKEMNTGDLDKQLARSLAIDGRDRPGIRSVLLRSGYESEKDEAGILRIWDERAVREPDAIAELLVKSGKPPTLLKVEAEDLETFFLRAITEAGGVLNA